MNLLRYLWAVLLLLNIFSASAQRYGSALGVRWGRSHFGGTYQHRVADRNTLEGLLTFNKTEILVGGLFEWHDPLLFNWRSFTTYVGGGPHVGFFRTDTLKKTFTGLSGIMGIEYKFPALPFVASLDFKPTFHFNHPNNDKRFEPQFAVSIRYVLLTYREQKKQWKKREKERNKKQKNDGKEQESNEKKGLFDIFDKNKDKDKDTPKNEQQPKNKDERKGLFDIFDKKKDNDKNKKQDDNNKRSENKKNKDNTGNANDKGGKKEGFWDKINIFKKKDNQ